MIKIIDPVFSQAIEKLKTDRPQNYVLREIDLYNKGVDAIQQEVRIIGNVLQVLDSPEYCDIKIQINETTNEAITLQKGIILFNFYRFFLTYEHIAKAPDYPSEPTLLKLLIGKDLIFVNEPTLIQKPFSKIVSGEERFIIAKGTGYQTLECKNADERFFFDTTGFNQVRGVVLNLTTLSLEHTLLIRQPVIPWVDDNTWCLTTEIKLAPGSIGTSFFVDLVGKKFQFVGVKDSAELFTLRLTATLWCL